MAPDTNDIRRRIAEASVWLARLRSDRPRADMQRDFRSWLGADQRNRDAFETVSGAWEASGGVTLQPRGPDPRPAMPVRQLVAATLVLGLILVGLLARVDRSEWIATGVGERRIVQLADGSVVTLNTDSKVRLRLTPERRLVVLDKGEASFDVAHDSLRPFVVQAGDARIVALGTSFDVRWEEGRLSVVLSEGKVRVVEQAGAGRRWEQELRPGQRLRDRNGAVPVVETVNLGTAQAWRTGLVVFDSTSLADAVDEMNRYSARKIRLSSGEGAHVRVSGSFKAGESEAFARALRDLHGFAVSSDADEILIIPRAG